MKNTFNPKTVKYHQGDVSGKGFKSQQDRVYDLDGCMGTLPSAHGADKTNIAIPVLTPDRLEKRQNGRRFKEDGEPSFTITKTDIHGVSDGMRIRRLTPKECERLMGYPETENHAIIELCIDQAKNYVNAVQSNPKLQELVLSVEKGELNSLVKIVGKNLSLKNFLKESIVQGNVSLRNTTLKDQHSLSVKDAEKENKKQNQESEEDTVRLSAFINVTEGRITHFGKEGLQVKEQGQTLQKNGQDVVKLYGKEIMQLAKNAKDDLLTEKIKHLMFTTSSDLKIRKIDIMLITLYFYAESVINGFIHQKTNQKNLSLKFRFIDGWTAEGTQGKISDTQRYKMCGNGIVSNVVKEVVKKIYERDNFTKTIWK